jgi:hypothetical protein
MTVRRDQPDIESVALGMISKDLEIKIRPAGVDPRVSRNTQGW